MLKENKIGGKDRTEAGCSEGTDEGTVSRLEVEGRVSGMQRDQKDESRGNRKRKFELLSSASGLNDRMTGEEGRGKEDKR